MLIVKVWCLPKMSEEQSKTLFSGIVAAAVSTKWLGVKSESGILCLFPPDAMSYGLGSEILIEISGVSTRARQEMTPEALAEKIGAPVHSMFPRAKVTSHVLEDIIAGGWRSR